MSAKEIDRVITDYAHAFNANDLDEVMTYFGEDAVYDPGDGTLRKGKAEIRKAFEPQFHDAYGAMRFDEVERIIDPEHHTAAFRWVCRHDLSRIRRRGLALTIRQILTRWFIGRQFGWEGVDVLHFDDAGKIVEKYTYAFFGTHPLLQRNLGSEH